MLVSYVIKSPISSRISDNCHQEVSDLRQIGDPLRYRSIGTLRSRNNCPKQEPCATHRRRYATTVNWSSYRMPLPLSNNARQFSPIAGPGECSSADKRGRLCSIIIPARNTLFHPHSFFTFINCLDVIYPAICQRWRWRIPSHTAWRHSFEPRQRSPRSIAAHPTCQGNSRTDNSIWPKVWKARTLELVSSFPTLLISNCLLPLHIFRPLIHGVRVAPSDIEKYRATHGIRAPGCLCASESQDPNIFTESKIYVSNHPGTTGEHVAGCRTHRCKYFGLCPFIMRLASPHFFFS